ncbi:heterotetrameric sarcosine oxidase gamma subunit [Angulomicrobium tetraedrale]|uniref:Heterotetrameric sarcosine oxidase gamma subunit n=1 Tax=Ancylobacter tetraedralis TaxID=217068 RepID=A0A839ZG05_9HYPH|nr:sarcosine oxidase subunit gamma family protein [Ancylobacter tetraedralis]MBB3773556.1 heterotetrameric sarcosine oxidase gamma subunit [Ancylobacter tetraedralis]
MADGCHIARQPPAALIEVVAREDAWSAGLSDMLRGLADGADILVLSPERRLVRAADMSRWREPSALAALAMAGGRLVDVSHAWQPISLGGAGARAVLERGVELDLDPRRFPTGRVAATLCARVPVLLLALEGGGYMLFVATSYTDWLMAWLETTRHNAGLSSGAGTTAAGIGAVPETSR